MGSLTSKSPAGSAVKRATSVSLAEDPIREARALGVNVSRACERDLAEEVSRVRRQRWLGENASAMNAYNARIARDGLPLAHYRWRRR